MLANLMNTALSATTGTGVFSGITSESLMSITDGIKEIIPIIIPVVVVIAGIKIAWSWFRKGIKG